MFSPINKLDYFLYFRNITRAQHRELLRDAKRQMKEAKDKKALYRDLRAQIASSYPLDKKKRAGFRFSFAAIAFYMVMFFLTMMFHLEQNLNVTHPFVVAVGDFFARNLMDVVFPIFVMPALVYLLIRNVGIFTFITVLGLAGGTLITLALLLFVLPPFFVAIKKITTKRYGAILLCHLLHLLLFGVYCMFLYYAAFYGWSDLCLPLQIIFL